MSEQLYVYRWGTNKKQRTMKGRTCRVIARGKRNSCCIKFVDNGQMEIVSRFAVRKIEK